MSVSTESRKEWNYWMTVKKINLKITKDLDKSIKNFQNKMDASLAISIGINVVNEMTILAKKGISPIGRGARFPAYKATALAAKERRNRYPFNQRNKFPSKRARPVNLTLSGDFLNDLTFRVKRVGAKISIQIGFFGRKSAIKEKGHREGANGQPRRPIIPSKQEQYSRKVQQVVIKLVQKTLGKKALKVK